MKVWEISKRLTVMLLCVLVLGMSVSLCISRIMHAGGEEEFSEQENRYLSAFPKFSFEALKEGEFTLQLDKWLSDHFPLRDFFVGVKTGFELGIGEREINGVYIAKDGYLIEKYGTPENTEKIIRAFDGLKETVAPKKVYLMLVPTASVLYREKLPKGAPMLDQTETMNYIYQNSGCIPVDVLGCLSAQKDGEEPLYYRTDHHWTTSGAYIAYQEFCRVRGFEPVKLEELEKKVVTEEFKGTIYSKVNDYGHKGDSIVIYENPSQRLAVHYTDTGEVSDSLYAEEYLEKKDKYSFFLNNIHPLTEITNETVNTRESLVLIKDSYANCMVPFLANHYKTIYVVDPRYYREAVSELIKREETVGDVLLLYNMNTIDMDLGIGGIY